MAKTNAERQRDYRQRKAAGEHPGPKCPGCREREGIMARFAEFKAKSRALHEQERAQIAAQQDEIERLTDALDEAQDGRSVPPCTVCGGALGCPPCSRGSSWEDDF